MVRFTCGTCVDGDVATSLSMTVAAREAQVLLYLQGISILLLGNNALMAAVIALNSTLCCGV